MTMAMTRTPLQRLRCAYALWKTSHSPLCTCPNISPSRSAVADIMRAECGFSDTDVQTLFKARANPSPDSLRSLLCFLTEFGFTHRDIRATVTKAPFVIASQNIAAKLTRLEDTGFTKPQIISMVKSCPRFLSASLDNRLDPNLKALSDIFHDQSVLLRAVERCPWLLYSDMETTINPSLAALRNSGIPETRLRVIISRRPRLLALGAKQILSRVDFIQKLGISQCSNEFPVVLQVFSHYSLDTVEEKFRHYKEMGFSSEEVTFMITKSPSIISLSRTKLLKVLPFAFRVANYVTIVQNPQILTYSFQRNIRPRGLVIMRWRELEPSKRVAGLATVCKLREKLFLERVGRSRVHDKLMQVYQDALALTDDQDCFKLAETSPLS